MSSRGSAASQKYANNQRKRGLVLVRIWVPAEAKDKVIGLGRKLRRLAAAQ